jgi:hypothetical protein
VAQKEKKGLRNIWLRYIRAIPLQIPPQIPLLNPIHLRIEYIYYLEKKESGKKYDSEWIPNAEKIGRPKNSPKDTVQK